MTRLTSTETTCRPLYEVAQDIRKSCRAFLAAVTAVAVGDRVQVIHRGQVGGRAEPTMPTQPGGTYLPLPANSRSYCSGPTGDCWWIRQDPNWQQTPGEVPSIEIGDTGGSFRASVRPHELEKLFEAFVKTLVAKYGLAAIEAIVANDPLNEQLDPAIYDLIVKDVQRSDAKLHRAGWRERLPEAAATP